jgi:hypothetical protein
MSHKYFRFFTSYFILMCLIIIIKNQSTQSNHNNLFSSNSNPILSLSLTTCEEVAVCIFTQIEQDVDKKTQICQEKTNCDNTCVDQRVAFDECTAKCTCKTKNDDFPVECFNNCKTMSKNSNFKLFADCLFEPCIPTRSNGFLIAIIIILVIAALAIGGFFLY